MDTFPKQNAEHVFQHAVNDWTNEVIPNAPKRIVKIGKEYRLELQNFTVRKSFPQNIVLLKDNRVFFVQDFEHVDHNRYTISGMEFITKREPFPGSKRVNIYLVSNLSTISQTISVQRIAAKCFVAPMGDEVTDELVESGNFNLNNCATWYVLPLVA